MLTAMPLANKMLPRHLAHRHGGARCIEQGRAVGKSTTASSTSPRRRHGACSMQEAPNAGALKIMLIQLSKTLFK